MAKYRPVPVKRLIAKLGLAPYREAPLVEEEPSVEKSFAAAPAYWLVPAQYRLLPSASAVTRGNALPMSRQVIRCADSRQHDGVVSAISEQAITVARG